MIPKKLSKLLVCMYWAVPGLTILPIAPTALACSCVSPSFQQFQYADAVFTGKVLAYAKAKVRRGEDSIAWTFAVEKVFKGTVPKQQQVLNNSMGSCGIVFRVGERYQVYGKRNGAVLSTHICSGTRPLSMNIDELLRYPPLPGTRVDLNVFYAGRTTIPIRGEGRYIVPKDRIFCPFKTRHRFLTDRPFLGNLSTSIGGTGGNTLPDQAPWLIATQPQAFQPGVDVWPNLPYNSRLRGYLGEPKFVHCPDANRIFVVEQVLRVYEKDPDPKFFPTEFPKDYSTWSTFHNPELGYKLLYPPNWKLEPLPKQPALLSAIALRSPTKPNYPVIVRVLPYPPKKVRNTSLSSGPFTQWLPPENRETQKLSGSSFEDEVGEDRRRALYRFTTRDRVYEILLVYPMGFEASQEFLNQFIVMTAKFQLDDPSKLMPSSDF